jgi:hypothetical protein
MFDVVVMGMIIRTSPPSIKSGIPHVPSVTILKYAGRTDTDMVKITPVHHWYPRNSFKS